MSKIQRNNRGILLTTFFVIFVIINFIGLYCLLNYNTPDNYCGIDKADYEAETALSMDKLKNITKCDNRNSTMSIIQHDKYIILQNYIRAIKTFECHESITYATHGEFTYLDNLIPLLKRWKAPLSVSVYAPGSDFMASLNAIFYLRNCHKDLILIRDYATFHFFFDIPKDAAEADIFDMYNNLEKSANCYTTKKYLQILLHQTYKTQNYLDYPVNVARNIARNAASTHYILLSDIELYPSPNFVPQFFKMILDEKNKKFLDERSVFVFPIFEILNDVEMPESKQQLIDLINDKKVFWFHQMICPQCHSIPQADRWLQDSRCSKMSIFSSEKRVGDFHHWEPIYVGTNNDPLYDERLTYAGRSDKMPQAYTMCILDYNFHVLSNAFLIHRNGIKTTSGVTKQSNQNTKFIMEVILPEIEDIYGKREGCRMY